MIRQGESARNALFLSDEEGRLRALNRLQALDADPEEAFENIVSLVKAVFSVPICAISLVASSRQFFVAERGLGVRETGREVSFCAHAIQKPEPFVVTDAALDVRFAENALVTGPPHIRSYAGIPLMTAEGYQVGALCVIDRKPRQFSGEQIALLQQFAANVVHELELRLSACSDHLTLAMNRRGWMKVAEAAFAKSRSAGARLCVAVLDIDWFKAVNDAHGHAAGDQVLKAFSALCRNSLGERQKFGRIGGEEFALLLPDADAADAIRALDRVREAFASTTHHVPAPVRCTVSVGIAECEAAGASLDALLSRADFALYEAKAGGRNRCVLARPQDASPIRAIA
jgi:diguanylate cyclase (GGDEF)-like protein